jgi:Tol biopolymer transport system component
MKKGKWLIALWILVLITACNPYTNHEGVTFVAGAGKPPVDSIVWSPADINQVLVTSTDLNHFDNQLFILNTKTLNKNLLQKSDNGMIFGNGWSPDGKHILFTITPGKVDEKSETITMSSNGGEKEVLTEGAVGAAWSPDGKSVAFFSYGPKISEDLRKIDLHLFDLQSKEDRIVLSLESTASSGLSWSPDGQKLVFAQGNFKLRNIYIFDIVKQELVQLTTSGLNNDPDWSPRDNVIVYVGYFEDGTSSLFLIRPDGSCKYEIKDLDRAWSPTWLPDGRTLGFVGIDGIYTLDLEKMLGQDYQEILCQ